MNNRTPFVVWPDGDGDKWNYKRELGHADHIVFELPKLPNFADPRFHDLGEQVDNRPGEVARRQLQMLRQLHSLDSNCAISLRLRRDGYQVRLFVVVRVTQVQPVQQTALNQLATQIQQMFPKEYNFVRVQPNQPAWQLALDLHWAQYVDELLKPEDHYNANTWPYFYIASLWQPQPDNSMEHLCRNLVNFQGEVMADVTLIPTRWGNHEEAWVDSCTRLMREAQNGERIYNSDGMVIKSYDPLPNLRHPLENYEDLQKRYKESRLFLYSCRIFASHAPSGLTQALATSATRSNPQIISLKPQHKLLGKQQTAGRTVDIVPEIHADWWDKGESPLRSQRLHRLTDVDEIVGFWRLPIPVKTGFPGFELDTGLDVPSDSRKQEAPEVINLGTLTDDAAKSASLPATFNREGLTKHGLVVGVPGSGKTTTMFNILHQLWAVPQATNRIPFIVLEPAKTEYRALKTISTFQDDLLIFTLGDERVSPFRFNPFEVPHGIPLESHISRLNACFVGAFNLFDPLPLLLDKAIRQTYEVKGWFDDSIGGEPGLEVPTLTDLYEQADQIVNQAGYSHELRDNFNAALNQRLDSLRRGSKGRMLDTKQSVPFDLLMQRPVILELDALNEDEKALMMMFILTFVYEHAKANRRSGSPLKHVLLVEEAHNLIGRGGQGNGEFRANPREHAIRLFIRMLAEMRALGQGILIADQLPTAIAPEAIKQTNLKLLMRMTAMDDRVEMGNTMDLEEKHLKAVTHFKSGQAYAFLEDWDTVRQVQTTNFKRDQNLEIPPDDPTISEIMNPFEQKRAELFMPFPECPIGCQTCNRRVRSQAERFVRPLISTTDGHYIGDAIDDYPGNNLCQITRLKIEFEMERLCKVYGSVNSVFMFCSYVHLLNSIQDEFQRCKKKVVECECKNSILEKILQDLIQSGSDIVDGFGSQ
ncbi:DUF87 domain-containing protein [Anaerolineales bacterium HSG24]|nr:DUF87 domain-containing protein [Anaerolineales bacterium HSG24]